MYFFSFSTAWSTQGHTQPGYHGNQLQPGHYSNHLRQPSHRNNGCVLVTIATILQHGSHSFHLLDPGHRDNVSHLVTLATIYITWLPEQLSPIWLTQQTRGSWWRTPTSWCSKTLEIGVKFGTILKPILSTSSSSAIMKLAQKSKLGLKHLREF